MTQQDACIDKELLVSYIYDECSEFEHARVKTHLQRCTACASEIDGLRDVRLDLQEWHMPSEVRAARGLESAAIPARRETLPVAAMAPPRRFAWTESPWARAAAAVVLMAGGAGLANLDVRVADGALVVRTGWKPATASATAPAAAIAAQPAPWRTELTALEQQLRREMAASTEKVAHTSTDTAAVSTGPMSAEMQRYVRSLVADSELKQERELALRLAEVVRDVNTQRRADLDVIQQGFGRLEGSTGVAVEQQRQLLNYLVRTSQTR